MTSQVNGNSVFDTFPWPQFEDGLGRVTPCAPSVDSNADASPRSSGARGATRPTNDIAKIEAVAEAGREVRRVRAEALTQLKGGDPVTAYGVPKNYPDPKNLVTDDCVRPAETEPTPIL